MSVAKLIADLRAEFEAYQAFKNARNVGSLRGNADVDAWTSLIAVAVNAITPVAQGGGGLLEAYEDTVEKLERTSNKLAERTMELDRGDRAQAEKGEAQAQVIRLQAEVDALRERERGVEFQFRDLREDCLMTYMGGYSDERDIEIFRHGMVTVCNVVDSLRTVPGSESDIEVPPAMPADGDISKLPILDLSKAIPCKACDGHGVHKCPKTSCSYDHTCRACNGTGVRS